MFELVRSLFAHPMTTWARSERARHACCEPIRAMGVIIVCIFALYPSMTSIYGVSVGIAVLMIAAIIKSTRINWLVVFVAGGVGYWHLWLELIDSLGSR